MKSIFKMTQIELFELWDNEFKMCENDVMVSIMTKYHYYPINKRQTNMLCKYWLHKIGIQQPFVKESIFYNVLIVFIHVILFNDNINKIYSGIYVDRNRRNASYIKDNETFPHSVYAMFIIYCESVGPTDIQYSKALTELSRILKYRK